MQRIIVSLIVVTLAVAVFASSSVPKSKAKGDASVVAQTPRSRCTRLKFGPRQKKKKSKKVTAAYKGPAMPGTRCTRLSSGGRPGSILPNTPPTIGLATSTSYIATNAETQVKLKAIACDADGDNLLYAYTTTCGRVTGEGASVVWHLSSVTRPAACTVSVEVDDGCGCISSDTVVVTLE